jgi:predicted amidophosphoribosyltransferase
MSQLFGKRCPKSNHENNSDANFCINCGTPLSGSKGKKCGACGAENRYDAVYCKECGRNLSINERIEIRGNHWARRDGDFAARLEIDDLPVC